MVNLCKGSTYSHIVTGAHFISDMFNLFLTVCYDAIRPLLIQQTMAEGVKLGSVFRPGAI